MRITNFHIPTIKEDPSDAAIISHKLLLKGGFIRQIASGLYTLMPLGVKVMQKISNIIREELDKIGANEVIFPIVQNNDAWVKSGRSSGYCGKETMRLQDRHGNEMLLSPTAEESANIIFGMDVKSYKELPMSLYQINTKFRDEIRPRFGLMRAREFTMLDSYSFDNNEENAIKTYKNYMMAYLKIFKRMETLAIPMSAPSGEIGGNLSHEFHIIAKNGESGVFYDKKITEMMKNIDNIDLEELNHVYAKTEDEHDEKNCPVSPENLEKMRGIEVGHIFYYADKYSKAMDVKIQDNAGKLVNPVGGCYGIGISRLVAAIIEAHNDENGMIWPKAIAPFEVILINLASNDENITKKCDEIYKTAKKNGIDILYDDSSNSTGNKLNNTDLIGIPVQIIIGKKSFSDGVAEVKFRKTGEKKHIKFEGIEEFCRNI